MINESSFAELYQSVVNGFPNTTKRQHVVDTIQISGLKWTPFLGMKTLFLRGLAENLENGNKYKPIIVFKNVQYLQNGNSSIVAQDDGRRYYLESLSRSNNEVLVRCFCEDFYWRLHHYDHIDKSLYSHNRKPYIAISDRGPVNPGEVPGVCKHIMALFSAVQENGLAIL